MENQNRINIELTEDVAQGTYANLAIITHSSSEFVLDFVHVAPCMPKAKVKSRIILTPENAKRLQHDLQDSISRYEASNGTIKTGNNFNGSVMPVNFGNFNVQA
ncbi:MAG: DUF3467 domain-containing protein [Prevotellaceae bacterium]|nr:DUF3467 domain-containing protein [Prevotellaceae bacterium]